MGGLDLPVDWLGGLDVGDVEEVVYGWLLAMLVVDQGGGGDMYYSPTASAAGSLPCP